tara:strand:+ start:665 stop:1039 length:375 start_codon:yes stop_codon:yes gene_type:complete
MSADLLVEKVYQSIMTYANNNLEKINYLSTDGDYYYSTYIHGLSDDEQIEPLFEVYFDNEPQGSFKSYGGLFNMSDIKDWIRTMIKNIENKKNELLKDIDLLEVEINFVNNIYDTYLLETIEYE